MQRKDQKGVSSCPQLDYDNKSIIFYLELLSKYEQKYKENLQILYLNSTKLFQVQIKHISSIFQKDHKFYSSWEEPNWIKYILDLFLRVGYQNMW